MLVGTGSATRNTLESPNRAQGGGGGGVSMLLPPGPTPHPQAQQVPVRVCRRGRMFWRIWSDALFGTKLQKKFACIINFENIYYKISYNLVRFFWKRDCVDSEMDTRFRLICASVCIVTTKHQGSLKSFCLAGCRFYFKIQSFPLSIGYRKIQVSK